MSSLTRALGALTATAVITTGIVAGTTAPAGAAENEPPARSQQAAEVLPILQSIPLITGTPGVGNPLAFAAPVWTLAGLVTNLVSTDIVWTRNGLPIPGTAGLTSFVPGAGDAGSTISAVLTGSVPLLGIQLPPIPLVGVLIPLLTGGGGDPDALEATNLPLIGGLARVGETLTATAPTWNMPATTTFQWLRDGVPIAGATNATYVVSATDEAKSLAVRAFGTAGAETAQVDSSLIMVLLEQVLNLVTAPSITGTPAVNGVLGSTPGTWSSVLDPLGLLTPQFSYQWLRDGLPIPGATDSSLPLGFADAGRELVLQVGASLLGFLPGLASTQAVQVPKAASSTQASLAKKKIKKSQRGVMRVVLAPGAASPAGQVTVYDKLKPIMTTTLAPSDNGRTNFTLPKLKKGKHQLRAVYLGNDVLEPSVSNKAVLKVKKPKKRKNR